MAREKGMGNLQREKSGRWTMRVCILREIFRTLVTIPIHPALGAALVGQQAYDNEMKVGPVLPMIAEMSSAMSLLSILKF